MKVAKKSQTKNRKGESETKEKRKKERKRETDRERKKERKKNDKKRTEMNRKEVRGATQAGYTASQMMAMTERLQRNALH